MAPNQPRTTDSLIAELAKRVERLQSALARGPILPSYTSATLPAGPPTGLEVLVTDLGLRAYWNGSAWIYPMQPAGHSLLTASVPFITLPVPSNPQIRTLRVAWAGRSDNAGFAAYMCLRLNGDSTAAYTWQINQVEQATAGPANSNGTVDRIQIGTLAGGTASAGCFGSGEFVIPNAGGNTYKAPAGHSTSTNASNNAYSGTYGGMWLNAAAVSSITLFADSGNLVAGTEVSLYAAS